MPIQKIKFFQDSNPLASSLRYQCKPKLDKILVKSIFSTVIHAIVSQLDLKKIVVNQEIFDCAKFSNFQFPV